VVIMGEMSNEKTCRKVDTSEGLWAWSGFEWRKLVNKQMECLVPYKVLIWYQLREYYLYVPTYVHNKIVSYP
jgi:hypothetical protein